jgi:hypothetical protein
MVLYIVGHNKRSGKIELNLTPYQERGIEIKNPGVLMDILSAYKKITGYKKFIHWHGLTFKKKESTIDTILSNNSTNLGACDKDWCNYCRRGDYTKCPNR